MPFINETKQMQIADLTGKMTEQVEKDILLNYKKSLDVVRDDMAKIYAKYGRAGKLTHAEMTKYNRLNNLHNGLSREIGKMSKINGVMIDRLSADVYEESFFQHAYLIEDTLKVNLRFGALNPKVVRASVQNPISGLTLNEILNKNRTQIILKIKQDVTQGIIQGEGYRKMAKRLKDTLGGDAVKSLRVARTESHRNQVAGHLASIDHVEEQGIQLERIWISTLDERTRSTHRSMDGNIAGPDNYFILTNGAKVQGPGMTGFAGHDINCRCVVIEAIKDEALTKGVAMSQRRIKGEGVKQYETYEEWHKRKTGAVSPRMKYVKPKPAVKPKPTKTAVKPKPSAKKKPAGIGASYLFNKQTYKKALTDLQPRKMEKTYSFNDKGDVIFSKRGQKYRINYTPGEMKIQEGAAVRIHNHPGPGNVSFSTADINTGIGLGVKETQVITPNGIRFRMVFPDVKPNAWQRNYLIQQAHNWNQTIGRQESIKRQAGKMTWSQIVDNHWDEVWQETIKTYNQTYPNEKILYIKEMAIE
jgi:SPP1 gp7 family putative phage head morphogenesis protein